MGARRCQPGTTVRAKREFGLQGADAPARPAGGARPLAPGLACWSPTGGKNWRPGCTTAPARRGRRCEVVVGALRLLRGGRLTAPGQLAEENDHSMDIPQVGDQVRKAPTQAIRAVFAGIGKILLAADRPQAGSRPAGPKHAAPGGRAPQTAPPGGRAPQTAPPDGRAPRTAPPGGRSPQTAPPGGRVPQTAPSAATASQRWRSLDETGNVRLLSTEELTVGHGTVVSATPIADTVDGEGEVPAEEETMPPAASQPLTGNVPIGAGFVVHELPLPGYDTLSVASIRARLRSLDFDQLQALLMYEQKNAERAEIIAMIERRIAKLESDG